MGDLNNCAAGPDSTTLPSFITIRLDDIAATGYGLTLGIQSRIDTTVCHIVERLSTGNIYVNRNMIGAVVGVQPFGGEGLSGTGPKAGGPNYVAQFMDFTDADHPTEIAYFDRGSIDPPPGADPAATTGFSRDGGEVSPASLALDACVRTRGVTLLSAHPPLLRNLARGIGITFHKRNNTS